MIINKHHFNEQTLYFYSHLIFYYLYYFCIALKHYSHNNLTTHYQHPIHSRPPPPLLHGENDDNWILPRESHSHSLQVHHVMDTNTPPTDTRLDSKVLRTCELTNMQVAGN